LVQSLRVSAFLILAVSSSLTQRTGRQSNGATPGPPAVEARVKGLHQLLNEQCEYTIRTSPEFASILGDKRYNDRLSDFSQAGIDKDIAQNRILLSKFEAVNTAGFLEQGKLNLDLMVRNLRQTLEAVKFREREKPRNQVKGN